MASEIHNDHARRSTPSIRYENNIGVEGVDDRVILEVLLSP